MPFQLRLWLAVFLGWDMFRLKFLLWLEKGKYAKYIFKSESIYFTNGTSLYIDGGKATAIFGWECLSVENNVAELNITFT